jgi:hypothetical protein
VVALLAAAALSAAALSVAASSKQQHAFSQHLQHDPIEEQSRWFSHYPAFRPVSLPFFWMKFPFFPIAILWPKNGQELGA